MLEPKGFIRSPLLEDPKTRYFVITSNIGEHVVKSVQYNVWATQRKNEQKLNDAFQSSTAVILVFSVNKSGAFQGYARMRSLTGRATCRSDPFNGFGRLFNVEWLRLHDIDVTEVNHLRNPLDDSRQVGFSRDGQEVAHDVGAELCRHFDVQIYKEDPESYEPVTDEQPRTDVSPTATQATPTQLQLALPLPRPGEGQGRTSSSPPMVSGCTALALLPSQPASQQQGQPFGGCACGHTRGRPAAGPVPQVEHMPGPCAAHGPLPMHFPPPSYGFQHYGPPPWALPHVVIAGERHHGRHQTRRRKRRRSSSYSYDSQSDAHRKDRKRRKKKHGNKKSKGRRERHPDFENMSYEEYMQWWHKTHPTACPGAPAHGGPAHPAPAGAGPPGPSPPPAVLPSPPHSATAAPPSPRSAAATTVPPAKAELAAPTSVAPLPSAPAGLLLAGSPGAAPGAAELRGLPPAAPRGAAPSGSGEAPVAPQFSAAAARASPFDVAEAAPTEAGAGAQLPGANGKEDLYNDGEASEGSTPSAASDLPEDVVAMGEGALGGDCPVTEVPVAVYQ